MNVILGNLLFFYQEIDICENVIFTFQKLLK
jgi:hypothetical protein